MSEKTDTDFLVSVQSNERPTVKKVPCEVYSRIVGYLRPVQNWNRGKQQEFHDRKAYRSLLGTADTEVAGKVLHSDR